MNSTLQELRAYITASGLESPSPNHASISAYIETNIIKNPNSLFKNRVPPLDIVLYAIRLLLAAPTLREIPDLLDFTTTIEFYRKLALQRVEEALTIQRYMQANDTSNANDTNATLTEQEVERLEYHKRNGPMLRTIYIEMIFQYCQWDIYHLWMSDPPRPTDVTLRLCEYFPDLNEHYQNSGAKSPRLFHDDLTEAERAKRDERGIECCTFVVDSYEWSQHNRQFPGQAMANIFQTSEFSAKFPCEVELSNLRTTMSFYLGKVEKMDDFWYDISQLWMGVGTFFYGIYLVLFCICVYILLNRPHNLGNTILLVTAIALFTLATVQAVINLVLGAADIDNIDIPYDQLVSGNSLVYAVNNFIADGLVVYRCYAVWNKNIFVTILPILMLIAVTVLGVIWGFDANFISYPFFALSLATNVLVTILTAGRIWWISRHSRAYLKTTEKRVESGMLYSATVLAYMVVISIPSVSILGEPIFQMLVQIMGIAPTLIIVRVGLEAKGEELKATSSRSSQRPLFGIHKGQLINKDMPTIPADVEKGLPEL
ncbi:hypothetical protein B0H12DRAFT_1233900 [Mycena haematopus]|nr:hypothetical protein B0H12DRAFT_1233900 [Mycena haematopus]